MDNIVISDEDEHPPQLMTPLSRFNREHKIFNVDDVIISDEEEHSPQLMTRPSVIEAVPKFDRERFGQNQKLQNFKCPMCPRIFHNVVDLNRHVNECLDSDPRVTGKMYESRKLSEDRKPVKLKQKSKDEKNKEKDEKEEKEGKKEKKKKHIKQKGEKDKGNGKGGKPALIPSLDDLVIYQGEKIKLRLLLLQLGVETAKVNLTQLNEGTIDIKWNRSFVTEEIKTEIHGAKDWNEYTLRKRMRDAERDVEKYVMSKQEAHRTGMGDLDSGIDPTLLPIYEKTKYTQPETEIDVQMSQLKADLDTMRKDIDAVHTKKYGKRSQPNPNLELKAKHVKRICNPEDSDEIDPEMAEEEEVFENKKESDVDNPEIICEKKKGSKKLKGTLSNKNAERYDESRRYRENSVQALKKENGNYNKKEYLSSESDDDEPMEVTLKKFMKRKLKESKQNNKMVPQPASFPFLPYAMGMPYGGFGYPQSYMQVGGYPYGMTTGSPPDPSQTHQEESIDKSNGGDSGSDPPPPPMQYNHYGGFLPGAGPGAGGFPPGAMGSFPLGAVGGFPPGSVGGFPPTLAGGFQPGGIGGFPPRPFGAFSPAAVRGSMPGARPAATHGMAVREATGRSSVDEKANRTSEGLGSHNRKSVISGVGRNGSEVEEFGYGKGRVGFRSNGGFIGAAVSADSSLGNKRSDTFSTVNFNE